MIYSRKQSSCCSSKTCIRKNESWISRRWHLIGFMIASFRKISPMCIHWYHEVNLRETANRLPYMIYFLLLNWISAIALPENSCGFERVCITATGITYPLSSRNTCAEQDNMGVSARIC
eukprot:NODE_390_length_9461_cov_0.447768.p5 type:complete len:119 gc:universal NODE_390_length_9461_cov_0.447768:142-498(+)